MILIDIIEKNDINGYFYYYIDHMKSFYDDMGHHSILVFEQKDCLLNTNDIARINDAGIEIYEYKDYEELINFLQNKGDTIYINTFYEKYIPLKNKIKKDLGQPYTKDSNFFINKATQRSTLYNSHPETVVKSKKINIYENVYETVAYEFEYPFFIKAISGTSSIGSCKIDDIESLRSHIETIKAKIAQGLTIPHEMVIEEFIEGDLYAMSYFVDQDQGIYINKVMKQRDDLHPQHRMLLGGEVSREGDAEIDREQLKELINKTVLGGDIKNTFVCHQFKKTPTGELKTIELNGRIGGFNLELYSMTFKLNFFKSIGGVSQEDVENTGSSAFFWIYPKEEISFLGYNKTFIDQIHKLSSKYRFYTIDHKLGQKVGLPSQGYSYSGIIILYNIDRKKFEADIEFIKSNYLSFFA